LRALHRQGKLSDAEYEKARAALMAALRPAEGGPQPRRED
jgi:hypothetical protein